DLRVGRCDPEGHRVLLDVDQLVDPAGVQHRQLVARDERRRRQRFSRVQRAPDDARLGALRQLGYGVDRLGRIALRVAHDQLDLATVDAAGVVDLVDRELGPSIDADTGRRTGTGQRRQIADLYRLVRGNRGRREAGGQRDGAGGGTRQDLPPVDWA